MTKLRTIVVAVLLAGAAALPAHAIDFAAGELKGEVIWNGARIAGPNLWTNTVDLPGIASQPVNTDGAYRFAAVQPGSYQLGFYGGMRRALPEPGRPVPRRGPRR